MQDKDSAFKINLSCCPFMWLLYSPPASRGRAKLLQAHRRCYRAPGTLEDVVRDSHVNEMTVILKYKSIRPMGGRMSQENFIFFAWEKTTLLVPRESEQTRPVGSRPEVGGVGFITCMFHRVRLLLRTQCIHWTCHFVTSRETWLSSRLAKLLSTPLQDQLKRRAPFIARLYILLGSW